MISTKGVPPKKPSKSSSKGEGETNGPALPKNLKTHLSKKELNHYRDLLMEKRREIIGDLGAIEKEALRSVDGGTHMPIHMADVGTDTYDQDFMLGLAEAERKQLAEIADALMRIQQNTYGVCMMTGNPIPEARLEAKPWAKYTIEAARQVEGGYAP
jgi:RNA polymerase-binding protein DksA